MISLDEKISTVNFFTHKMYSNDFVMNENFSYTEVAVLTFKYTIIQGLALVLK